MERCSQANRHNFLAASIESCSEDVDRSLYHDQAPSKDEAAAALENKLSHIEAHDFNPSEWLPAHMLAERIGANRRWVHRIVKEFGIEPEPTQFEGAFISCYPPFTLALLKDEYVWRNEYRALPSTLTITDIAEHSGRSWGWTADALAELDLEPIASEQRSSNKSRLYAKSALKKIREITKAFPMSEDWFNMHQLVVATGEDREWVERRLIDEGVVPEIRRSALTGKLLDHYPPSAATIIERAKRERPEAATAGWLTSEAIPAEVGRSYNWCKARLAQYRQFAVTRQDNQGVSRLHYPPAVIAGLEDEQASIEQYPEAGEYITFSEIVKVLGRSKLWVQNRLAIIDTASQMRRDKKGRVREHYPEEVIQQILNLPEDFRK